MKEIKRKVVLYSEDGMHSKPYDEIGAFVNGFAIVRSNKLFGFIDEQLNEVVAPKYEDAHNFYNGFAIVKNGRGWGAIDKNGAETVEPQFHTLGDFTSCGLAAFGFAGRYGAIDQYGKVVVKPIYESRIRFHEGMARVRRGCRWGFIDESFEEVIPAKFDLVDDFMCGRAFVLLSNGQTHFIDHKGKVISN